jgi:site-specific DNA-methyltransferase (adenine-specific)
MEKLRARRNRTLTLTPSEQDRLEKQCISLTEPMSVEALLNRVICQDLFEVLPFLPKQPCVDLLFLDPPYNMDKQFNDQRFRRMSNGDYAEWLDEIITGLSPILKPTASIYPREIAKIHERLSHFQKLRKFWESKPD